MSLRVLIVALLAFGAETSNAADCPSNFLQAGQTSAYSTLPQDYRSESFSDPNFGSGGSLVSYDVPAGRLSLQFNSSGDYSAGGDVYVEDDFTVMGLAGGTAVPITAHFSGTLSAYPVPYAFAAAHLKDTHGNDQVAGTPQSSYDLTLPVAALAGQPFRLHFELTGAAMGGGGYGSALFWFSGLPASAIVTSCQGYVGDPTVPARAGSWGRVKILYR